MESPVGIYAEEVEVARVGTRDIRMCFLMRLTLRCFKRPGLCEGGSKEFCGSRVHQ